jgi:hypothetical protein
MKFYTVIFEKDGETISTFSVHAKSELEAQLAADRFFRDHPEFSAPGNEELTVRVKEAHLP